MSAGRPARRGDGPRLRVGVISAGRVGAVLGAAFQRAGHEVVAVSGVSAASLRRAEELLPQVPVRPPDEVANSADLVLLAVPDDVLAGLVRGLVATGSLRSGQILVHTCGAHGVAVLEPAAEVGVLPLALHPAMTFTGRPEDVERLASACAAVTAAGADEASWNVGEVLALELGAEPVRVPEQARRLYHTALSHGANHLITLINECSDLLRGAGVEIPERVLAPILSASLDNALRFGDKGLTGPVSRGDTGTVRAHLAELRESAPEVSAGYAELARRTAARAEQAGLLDRHSASEVTDALDEEQR
ncbi:DUF2520 domain-containing protein [Saccharopolyspora sp. SCSIO 74807]|uniref:Rossmann-like and DUF2520 domain-containing protein n=1 Tax=Saccharopolyspora sp. SCSIO 74807 TaxID=3118084 RepID=UPI0030CFC59E